MAVALLTVAVLAIVYGALRSSRFRRWAEPVLSVLVAIVLIAAFIVWMTDSDRRDRDPQAPFQTNARQPITAEDIDLAALTFTQGKPINNFTVTGRLTNRSQAVLDYFTLLARLEDCAASPCREIGEDHALVIARLPPGESRDISLVLTLPLPAGGLSNALTWTTRIDGIHAVPAGPAAPPISESR
ncbi:hypothetical protein BJF93_20940 [Xaviernesmea oryzae]|uniref:DUF3426 domain-containing protein n=1 Tax=Xaviernesmea oryzae TaxID=464029 RepID=A0A1Q9AZV5_9HYPH|nr:hypothetical protein [Xaviernesmea oryzae]OLP61254.1 hypothetical protein BJF93_20940 [Xaviernesmea oryzae]SEL52206.1 hypothetical protein SAMN04487976_10966 [Xaviernesmea oryzae]